MVDVFTKSHEGEAPPVSRVAEGIWWIRLDLNESYDHVNVYLLDNGDSWTLVDTGTNTQLCRDTFERLLNTEPFNEKAVRDIVVTHFHPDHIGLAGWFCEHGARLITTRTTWLSACLLLTQDSRPDSSAVTFMERHGMTPMELEAFRRRPNTRYHDLVAPIPSNYVRISQNETLEIGGRKWNVRVGNGHAAEHATLWSDDGLAIVGDQILAGISPSLHVHPSEPQADVIGEWLESCRAFADHCEKEILCLPGHRLPFTDGRVRCQQLAESQRVVLERVLSGLAYPQTTVECSKLVCPWDKALENRSTQLLRTTAYLNHLLKTGLVSCSTVGEQYIWKRASRRVGLTDGDAAVHGEPVRTIGEES